MQLFQRPLRDMRDNTDSIRSDTDAIRSDVHNIHSEISGLNTTLKDLPGQIQAQTLQVERVAHDSFVAGALEFGLWGLVIGLILGLFIGGANRR
jgi:hypothetical protein